MYGIALRLHDGLARVRGAVTLWAMDRRFDDKATGARWDGVGSPVDRAQIPRLLAQRPALNHQLLRVNSVASKTGQHRCSLHQPGNRYTYRRCAQQVFTSRAQYRFEMEQRRRASVGLAASGVSA